MTGRLFVAIGLAVWGAVFALLLAALAVQADLERRWTEAWASDWERRKGRPIDELIDDLARQLAGWRFACRLLTWYLALAVAGLFALGWLQYWRWALTGDAFSDVMLFGAALVGLLFLPLRVVAEVGVGLLEAMHRQVRTAAGERLVVNAAEEIDRIPKPGKDAKKAEAPAGR